tara:strand:- start:154 stop:384 length:231 start_codon:yes stop_codon:yes gene_type:complete
MILFGGKKGLNNAMLNSYNRSKNRFPGMSENFYMKEALRARFRKWPEYQLEYFILDCNNINELINKIYYNESQGKI